MAIPEKKVKAFGRHRERNRERERQNANIKKKETLIQTMERSLYDQKEKR
jgi:hypothetical protein